MKFNIKKYSSSCDFICNKCGIASSYKVARQGCPACNNYLFKIALKNNPLMYDRHNQDDPYRLQTNRPGAEKPWKLTTPGSEETNPSGFGGRSRDGLSSDGEDKKEIPGSMGTMIDDPPPGGYDNGPSLSVSDVFTDPGDSLSATNRINRSIGKDLDSGPSGSQESMLNRSRQVGIYDDKNLKNPFNFVGKNQRGAYR